MLNEFYKISERVKQNMKISHDILSKGIEARINQKAKKTKKSHKNRKKK